MAVALATLAVAAAVFLVHPPEPQGAIAIARVDALSPNGGQHETRLPLILIPNLGQQPANLTYVGHFDLPVRDKQQWLLFIPTVNRPLAMSLNGQPLFDSADRALWSGPMIGHSYLLNLPAALLVPGHNEIRFVLERGHFKFPTYISRIFIGHEANLAPYFQLSVLLGERLKTMAMAAHLLLGVGIVAGYLYRRKDPLFAWLATMVALSFVISVINFGGFRPELQGLVPYVTAFLPALGVAAIGVAFALVDIPAPHWLRILAVTIPIALIVVGLLTSAMFIIAVGVPLLLLGLVVATVIVAWGAFRRDSTEARLMLAPFFLMTWLLMRDIGVIALLIDRPPILLAPLARPLFLAALTALLMRRLALSLADVDRANENLNQRLAAREAELAAMHREERLEAARLIRDQERQRLTHDLHDGISGHLVSIIAMSERAGSDVRPIEQAARDALDDLRLVIYSLDLGDRELPLALANFRERLIPQLRRIGVELDWSTADLPEVSGVTPGNALAILRILQEAITNAVKHGPARKIAVRGAAAGAMVAIAIENDGRPFIPGNNGFGLQNMRRRAQELRGEVHVESRDTGVVVTLLLPPCLPDFQTGSRMPPVMAPTCSSASPDMPHSARPGLAVVGR